MLTKINYYIIYNLMETINNLSKLNLKRGGQLEIQPALVNAWIAKNKRSHLVEKKEIATWDCPRPWG